MSWLFAAERLWRTMLVRPSVRPSVALYVTHTERQAGRERAPAYCLRGGATTVRGKQYETGERPGAAQGMRSKHAFLLTQRQAG